MYRTKVRGYGVFTKVNLKTGKCRRDGKAHAAEENRVAMSLPQKFRRMMPPSDAFDARHEGLEQKQESILIHLPGIIRNAGL
jgi:hypothetical protein